MLIEFSVGNFLSFKDVMTLSMVASDSEQNENRHVFAVNDYKLLKSSVIYGANASGKSNLIKAIAFARIFIINSSKDTQVDEEIPVKRFLLDTHTENKPSSFEFVFLVDNITYRYGFSLNPEEVVSEYLFATKADEEENYFERDHQRIKPSDKFAEGKGLESKTRKNALFLSVVAQFNGEISEKIIVWLKKLKTMSALLEHISVTAHLIKDDSIKKDVLNIIKAFDFGIEDLKVTMENFEQLPQKIQKNLKKILKDESEYKNLVSLDIKASHKVFAKGEETGLVEFDFKEDESKGTQALFSVLGPIMDTLKNANILIIDEFETSLHTLILIKLINLFNSKDQNPNNAQFIFSTHNINLLDQDLFRRDQVWFTDKDKYGATNLYSLADYDLPEKQDRPLYIDYLHGKFDAIPLIKAINLFDKD